LAQQRLPWVTSKATPNPEWVGSDQSPHQSPPPAGPFAQNKPKTCQSLKAFSVEVHRFFPHPQGIPLNSPAYYAPYNGAIEQGIKELKKEVARALPVPESWFVAVAAAQRNYQSRRCLGGLNAKDIYSQKQRRGRWNQRQHHQAFEWISCHAKAIMQTRMKTDQRSVHAAWRHAVEAWLSDQALIEVH
jgi:hypothetical protein